MRPEEPVARVMTESVVVIEASRPVSEAMDCFEQYQIHHLPVVQDGRLAGMLSSADLLKLQFFLPKGVAERARFLDERFRIEQIMRVPVTSCGVNSTVGEVSALFIDAGLHAVPVVDGEERVVGLVSTSDLIRALLYGPPRRGNATGTFVQPAPRDPDRDELEFHRKPTETEYATALRAATTLHVEERDPKYLGKALLYLDQRRSYLEKVLELADRFLLTGQDEHNHAQLLKAILAAKRADEHASGTVRVPFALE